MSDIFRNGSAARGQQGIEQEQLAPVQRRAAHPHAQQVRVLRQHEPGPRQHGQRNGHHAHDFGHRMAERVVAGDAHRLLVIALAVVVESPPLLLFIGEGLDDLDAAEGLFKGGVDDCHLFHRPAIGPLQRPRQPVRTRYPAKGATTSVSSSSRQQTQPARIRQANIFNGSRISLPNSDSSPRAS